MRGDSPVHYAGQGPNCCIFLKFYAILGCISPSPLPGMEGRARAGFRVSKRMIFGDCNEVCVYSYYILVMHLLQPSICTNTKHLCPELRQRQQSVSSATVFHHQRRSFPPPAWRDQLRQFNRYGQSIYRGSSRSMGLRSPPYSNDRPCCHWHPRLRFHGLPGSQGTERNLQRHRCRVPWNRAEQAGIHWRCEVHAHGEFLIQRAGCWAKAAHGSWRWQETR